MLNRLLGFVSEVLLEAVFLSVDPYIRWVEKKRVPVIKHGLKMDSVI